MNLRDVVNPLGLLAVVLSVVLLVVAGWALLQWNQGDAAEADAFWALLISAGIGAALGGLLWATTRKGARPLGRREALLLVAGSWLGGAALAALPYFIWAHRIPDQPVHAFQSWINCYFEAMSGLTTTGATVLTQIDAIPRSLVLWRALTNWLGGLGIVVLFVAVLPMLGVGGRRLYQIESPGPDPESVRPHIRDTARILWLIYLALSVAEMLALKLVGMSWFEAVCHTFATLATGGFSTTDASIGGYNSAAVDTIIILFMILAGINFGLYYQLIRRRFSAVWRDTELRVYLCLLLFGSAVVILSVHGLPMDTTGGEQVSLSSASAIRYGVFQTVSVQTTTGFCTADFNRWPFLAKAVMLGLMFVGGCGGSTGGGIKVIRVWIAFRVMLAEIERAFRPTVVRPIRIGTTTIDPEHRLGTLAYVLGILILFAVGAGMLMLLEQSNDIDFTTAASASVATLCNIGPGLARVGAIENYAWFTSSSKIVMILLMALGRLEVFAIIVLFVPRFWRSQ